MQSKNPDKLRCCRSQQLDHRQIGKDLSVPEHLMWLYDGDDQYYTSNTRLYLTYINREISNRNLFNEKRALRVLSEITALKTAMTIGYLLNRTVILPRFRIERKGLESQPNSLIHIKTFNTDFSGKYRKSFGAICWFLIALKRDCRNNAVQ